MPSLDVPEHMVDIYRQIGALTASQDSMKEEMALIRSELRDLRRWIAMLVATTIIGPMAAAWFGHLL